MSFGSVANPTAFSAYTNYTLNVTALNGSMRRLSRGVKSVVDDGAGVAISERMRSQADSTAKARNNADNAISFLQTADTWLQQINDIIGRMHELAIDASDATKTGTDRGNIQTEFSGLQTELLRITNGPNAAAKYNGQVMFGTLFSGGIDTQVGADSGQKITIELANLTSASTGTMAGGALWASVLSDTDLSIVSSAPSAISTLSKAVDFIANIRASVGAQQSRLEKTRTALVSYEDQIRTAESKVRSVDTARESAEMVKYQILAQIGTAMLAQANQLPTQTVQLVGGG